MAFVWWMYAADVVGSFSTALTLGAILSVFAYGAWAAYASIEEKGRPPFKLIGWAIGFVAVASVIPSTRTMYAIAATSAGKEALATPTGQKAVQALNVWLDKQIAEKPEK